jgi:RNA polymerase sigma factor (sigma-70 family)
MMLVPQEKVENASPARASTLQRPGRLEGAKDMATATSHPLIHHIRRLVGAPPVPDLPDAHLLTRFVAHGDQAAFEALVRRHGPLVLGVCRRVLGDWHAAEDAFQEVFTLLVRKGPSLRAPEGVGPWLFGVAYRTARTARARTARRDACERKVATPPGVPPADDLIWRDLRPVLDDAVACLPERDRAAFVLHYLGGVTVAEVARRLDWPRGTVATRLARARAQLRKRLARRGVTLSAAGLAAGLSAGAVAGALPPRLLAVTVRAAAALLAGQELFTPSAAGEAAFGQGGLHPMLTIKGKSLAAVLLVVALAAGGASLLIPGARADRQQGSAPVAEVRPAGDGDRAAERPPPERQPSDLEEAIYRALREQGRWQAGGGYTVFVKRLEGRRLLDVEVVRRAGPGVEPFAARARAGTFRLDRQKRAVLFDLARAYLTGEGGAAYADRKTLAVPLPPAPARAAAGGETRSVVEKQFRQFQVEITLARADAGGRDLGPHGKAMVLAEPRFLTVEGQEASIRSGGEVAVPGDEPGEAETVPFGFTVRVKVKRLGDGRLRLEAALERSQVEEQGKKHWRLRRVVVEATERVKLGEAIKLVQKDSAGGPLHWALVRVVLEESIQWRTESRAAEQGKDQKAPTGQGKRAYVLGPTDILQIDSAEGLLRQPVRGPHLVRPDGTLGLGTYGSVFVAGLTIEQARAVIGEAITNRLGAGGKSLKEVIEGMSVDVLAYNSQVYYVITDLPGEGEQVHRFPVTGNETVLEAVAQVKSLAAAASRCRVWVARLPEKAGGPPQVLPVDWTAITREGQTRTNYQLLPGDRLYVKGAGK